MPTNAALLEAASRKYRRTYDRLYVASMRAGSAAESDAIDRKLAAANATYDDAKRAYAPATTGPVNRGR